MSKRLAVVMSTFLSGTTKRTSLYIDTLGTVKERVTNEIRHKEYGDIILIWKSIEELKEKPNIS